MAVGSTRSSVQNVWMSRAQPSIALGGQDARKADPPGRRLERSEKTNVIVRSGCRVSPVSATQGITLGSVADSIAAPRGDHSRWEGDATRFFIVAMRKRAYLRAVTAGH